MTGPEHFREAESALEAALDRDTDDSARMLLVAEAQVHATLALTAATAEAAGSNPFGEQRDEWRAVLLGGLS